MATIEKIIVSLEFNSEEIAVGELVSDEKNIYFRYFQEFIKYGLEISPITVAGINGLSGGCER
jgi:serine/threonine-protein kinase HipA